MTATSTITTNSADNDKLKSRLASFLTKPYSLAVLLYMLGALVALLPVAGGDWPSALKRLLLVSASVALYFLISLLVKRPAHLRWLTALVIAGTTAVAILGTARVNTTSLRLTGLNYQVYSTLRNLLPFDNLPTVHQNVLGSFLVVFLPLALALALWDRLWWVRLYGLVCAAVIAGAILTTASRSAELGLVALVFVFGFFLAAGHPRLRLGVGLLLILGLAAGGLYLGLNGLTTIENGASRIEVWRTTLAMVADYPLTGAGLGQYQNHFLEYATPFLSGVAQPHAHNIFLQSLVEFGLSGFIASLLTLWVTLRLLITYRNLKTIEGPLRPVVAGALAGMVACFVSGLLEYGNWGGKFAPAFWLLPALLAAAQSQLRVAPVSFKWKWKWPPPLALALARFKLNRLGLPLALAGAGLALFLVLPLGLINLATILRPAQSSQTLYQATVSLSFWNATPLRNLGKLALSRNDLPAAQLYYQQALQRDPNDWLSLWAMGNLSEKLGDHTQAVAYWQRASTGPNFLQLANIELKRTPPNYPVAESYFRLALEIDPGSNEAVSSLIKIYNETDRKSEAVALLQRLLAKKPTEALFEQAADLADTPQQRLDLLLKANDLDPANYIVDWKLGEAYQAANQPEMAEKAYKQALVIRPAFQWPVRSLAEMYLKQGRAAEAKTLLEQFIANNLFVEKPDREFVWLARSDFTLGDEAAARANLAKALQYNPDSVPAYLFQGELAAKTGNPAQARAAYQKVLQLDPGNDAAKQALEASGGG
jgi:tetratricopeptide (TPR) repeat protein/O-antigen ligase